MAGEEGGEMPEGLVGVGVVEEVRRVGDHNALDLGRVDELFLPGIGVLRATVGVVLALSVRCDQRAVGRRER